MSARNPFGLSLSKPRARRPFDRLRANGTAWVRCA